MDKHILKELNEMSHLSCMKIQEEDGVLIVYVNGTYLKPVDAGQNLNENSVIKILDKAANEIIADETIVYKITFDSYIGYTVLNESYSAYGDDKFVYGNLFRVYTASRYLKFIEETTYAGSFTKSYKHYGILCLDQVVDVICEHEPEITKHLR